MVIFIIDLFDKIIYFYFKIKPINKNSYIKFKLF